MLNLGKEVASAQVKLNDKPVSERIRAIKKILPLSKVDSILCKHNPDRRRCSKCPATMMVWFVVAISLFGDDCYRQVFKSLHRYRRKSTPTTGALSLARGRLGIAVMRKTFLDVVRCLCGQDIDGAFYHGMKLIAVDGFVLDLPDTDANRAAFGKPKNGSSEGAFPQARVLALCEISSHVIFAFLTKPIRCGEVTMARYLYRFLPPGSLLTFDINFFAYDLVKRITEGKSHFLGRSKTGRILKPIKVLCDGSYLAKIYATDYDRTKDRNGTIIRVIDYTLDDPQRVGHHEQHRLVTSLLDATTHGATRLIDLYHERWEEEIAIDEIKTHQRTLATLRSLTPAGVVQEIYGMLVAHFVIRKTMFEAAKRAGVPPQRISFTGAMKVLRGRLHEVPRGRIGIARWYTDLIDEISDEVLPRRRNRINPRVIKKTQSKWPRARPEHRKLPKLEKKFLEAVVMLN